MKVIYTDLEDQVSEVYEDLEVSYVNANEFMYYENGAKVNVELGDSTIYITRCEQATTKLTFSLNKRAKCTVESTEGIILMESYTEELHRDKNRISIVYRVLQSGQEVAYRSVNFILVN